jgi:hypothetical protein
MLNSTQDILILSLQFLYAIGGLIVIASLIVIIVKNQGLINEKRMRLEDDFEAELAAQLSQAAFKEARGHTSEINGSRLTHSAPDRLKARVDKSADLTGIGGNHFQNKRTVTGKIRPGKVFPQTPYRTAATLAAKGLEVGEIRKRVKLPQCEVDLIARVHRRGPGERRPMHQLVLESIESR